VLCDLIESLLSAGFRHIFLLNGHGGNQTPFAEALYRISLLHRYAWVAAQSYWKLAAAELAAQTFMDTPALSHACEYETSMMLALQQGDVKMDLAQGYPAERHSAFYDPLGYAPSLVEISETFGQLTPNGAMGSPELASAEKGRKLLSLFEEKLVAFLQEFACWPLPGKRSILLRSSWQTVNIGDIAHTFGLLRLLDTYLPDAEVILWPIEVDRGVRERLQKEFPTLEIVDGKVDESGVPDTPELLEAFSRSSVLVHGSGACLVAGKDLDAWRVRTGKPYVIFGVTIDPRRADDLEGGTLEMLRARMKALPEDHLTGPLRTVLSAASAVFCRDTLSLDYLRQQKVGEHAAFGPDATFGCDCSDPTTAEPWLRENGVEPNEFFCVIPRLRWTPYHEIHANLARDPKLEGKVAINERTAISDHAALRELIILAVREGGLKVLLCPEMTYAVELARKQLFDPLPDDVKARTIWRDRYWLHDEAAAVYAQARAVVSMENHSPILALAQGTPALYVRQPTDTIKGQMWRDLGLGDCFFEVEETTGAMLWERLREILADGEAAHRKVVGLQQRARQIQHKMVAEIARHLPTSDRPH